MQLGETAAQAYGVLDEYRVSGAPKSMTLCQFQAALQKPEFFNDMKALPLAVAPAEAGAAAGLEG